MHSLQERDPLHIRKSRASVRVYTLMIVSILLFVGAIVTFSVNFASPKGQNLRAYESKKYNWESKRLSEQMSDMQVGFKIMPVIDDLRNKEMYILEHKYQPLTQDMLAIGNTWFFTFNQSYFWYNNTVKNFPPFQFDNETANPKESEHFCLHLWWEQTKREKSYSEF